MKSVAAQIFLLAGLAALLFSAYFVWRGTIPLVFFYLPLGRIVREEQALLFRLVLTIHILVGALFLTLAAWVSKRRKR